MGDAGGTIMLSGGKGNNNVLWEGTTVPCQGSGKTLKGVNIGDSREHLPCTEVWVPCYFLSFYCQHYTNYIGHWTTTQSMHRAEARVNEVMQLWAPGHSMDLQNMC